MLYVQYSMCQYSWFCHVADGLHTPFGRFMSNIGRAHLQGLRQILRYLGSLGRVLVYG